MPEELAETHRRLLEELRRLKARHGWTFAQLARKTGYSTASWQRYLSGRAMPPWDAVDALGRLASQEDGRLRALWESATAPVARQSASQRTMPLARNGEAVADGGSGTVPRLRPSTTLLASLLGTALLVGSSLALLSPWDAGTAPRTPPPWGAPPDAPVWPWPLPTTTGPPAGAPCLGNGCRGRDPYRLGCDRSSVPVHEVSADHRTLTLRYSPVCRAVWAEVSPGAGTSGLTVSGDGEAVTAPPGDARTGMLGAAPGRARGNVNLPGRQIGVSAGTSWVIDQ